jgi:tetratricopeptide (TPR) repeat protein
MRDFSEQSLLVYRSLNDPEGIAWALDRLAQALMNLGDLEPATTLFEESIGIFRSLEDDVGLGVTLTNLSSVALMRRDPATAAELAREALALSRELGRRWGMVPPLSNLGLASIMQGRVDEGIDLCRQSIRLAHELEYSEGLVCGLIYLAVGTAAEGEAEAAATLIGATDATIEATSYALESFESEMRANTVGSVMTILGDESFALAHAAGIRLTADEMLAFALGEPVVTATETGTALRAPLSPAGP